MIYFRLADYSASVRSGKYPLEFAMNVRTLDNIPIGIRFDAARIFIFQNGKTYYLKDRVGDAYQYTPEEQVVLALKSVLL